MSNALMEGYNFGSTVAGNVVAGEKQRRFNALAGQAYAAPDNRNAFVQQAVGLDASAGLALDKSVGDMEDRQTKSLVNAAQMLIKTPEQYRAAQWSRIRPGISKFIPNAPEQYDDTVLQAAQSLVDAYGGVGVETSAGMAEFNALTKNLSPEERARAQRVKLGLAPREVTGAAKTLTLEDENGVPRTYTFDPMTKSYTPSGLVGRAQEVESGAVRTAESGVDLAFKPAIEGAVTSARQGAEIAALPQREAIETQATIDRAAGTERVKSASETNASAPGSIATMQQSIDSIDMLLKSPELGSIVGLGRANPLNYVPGSKSRGLMARAEQVSGQAFLAAFNQLKGGGAITEKEGEAATRAMARLDRSQSEEDYRAALADLKAAIEPAIQRQRQKLQGARQTLGERAPAGKAVKRRGMFNGRRVVQYTDGSTSYVD